MEKTFYHRPWLTRAGRTVYVMFGISIALCWLPFVLARLVPGFMAIVPFDFSFGLSVTLFFGGMLILTFSSELRKSYFLVTGSLVVHKTPYRVTVVKLDEATSLTSRFHFVRGRLVELCGPASRISMGFTIEGLHGLVDEIEKGLRANGRGAVIDRRQIRASKRRARIIDLLLSHGAGGAVPFLLYAAFVVIAGALVAGRIWFLGILAGILWTVTGMLFAVLWLVVYLLIFVGQRVRANPRMAVLAGLRGIDAAWLATALAGAGYLAYGIWFKYRMLH